MENKAHALAAGTFVLALMALLVAMAVWLTRDKGERHLYDISTAQAISGLQPQAAVRFRGVPVGKVESIGFDPSAQGQVLVRISVDVNTPITRNTFAIITAQGVTGLGFIQLDDDAPQTERLAANDANPPRIPLRPGVVDQLLQQSATILGQVQQVSDPFDQPRQPSLGADSHHPNWLRRWQCQPAGGSAASNAGHVASVVAPKQPDPAVAANSRR
jgi:phospholipid/cholesterol/gamma-HCH transport system substrate-binding protein